jgi:hypothetical protein
MHLLSRAAALLIALSSAAAWAEVPLPRAKPSPPGVEQMAASLVPVPRPKPDRSETRAGSRVRSAAQAWPSTEGRWPSSDVAEARAACEALLGSRDIDWTPAEPMGAPGGCGAPAPIDVRSVAGVRITPSATLTCAMAAGLHDWLTEAVQPAARRRVGKEVVEIRNASSYACRRRNNSRTGKLSEHARANALDISDFVFRKTAQASVGGDWGGIMTSLGLSGRGSFLESVRRSSCAYFNTVLGPGSDAAHKDHFHLDMMTLRPGRGKMCR